VGVIYRISHSGNQFYATNNILLTLPYTLIYSPTHYEPTVHTVPSSLLTYSSKFPHLLLRKAFFPRRCCNRVRALFCLCSITSLPLHTRLCQIPGKCTIINIPVAKCCQLPPRSNEHVLVSKCCNKHVRRRQALGRQAQIIYQRTEPMHSRSE
jgi:hypothetical protein